MPVDLDEADTGGTDLHFADDLEGLTFELRESAVYEAEEVRKQESSDVPKFGSWVPITSKGDGWAVAVGELVEELQRYENPMGVTFEVTRCEKSGPQQTDPYEVNIEMVNGDPQQVSL